MYTSEQIVQQAAQYMEQLPFPKEPAGLYDPVHYALDGGGKRIRPALLLAACNAFSDDLVQAFPAAAALEIYHTSTLLHDDIMDNAALRRGKPAVHKQWNLNTAILSGDVMIIEAHRLLGQCNGLMIPVLLAEFSRMAAGVCEGQQYDMDFECREQVERKEYLKMIRLKTACMMACAAKMGGMIGGADAADCAILYRFGEALGVAFQLQDDLLDTYGDAETLGKAIGGDILEGKKSFLMIAALEAASPAQRQELSGTAASADLSAPEKIARVRAIYDALDVAGAAKREIDLYTAQALTELDALAVDPVRLEPLRNLAAMMVNRKK